MSQFIKCPHSAAAPTAHPSWSRTSIIETRNIKQRTKTLNGTRNEICLTANEILLRKKKSDKSDEISLGEVAVVSLKMQYDIMA